MKAQTRKRPSNSAGKVRPKRKTTRVTVDFPDNEHKRLKALAALEGVTMQEYIRTHVMNKVNAADIPDAKFKKLMGKILDEHGDVLNRLAKK